MSRGIRSATAARRSRVSARVPTAIVLATCVGVAMLGAPPRRAGANAGVPSYGGVPVGEVGGLADVRIVSETLAIDLRPVDGRVDVVGESEFMSDGSGRQIALGTSAIVTATYSLTNDGDARAVDLRFAHGAERVRDFRVEVDGHAVDAHRIDLDLGAAWRPPRYTPGPDGPESFLYAGDYGEETIAPRPWSFRAALPTGPSRLTVRYRADAGTYVAQPLIVRQFAYILAPARTWAGFGTLDVTVNVPPGWQAWSDPPLERRGDTLVGRFDGVPADALALTVQPAESAARIAARWSSRGVLLLVAVAVGPLCWRVGRRRRRRWPRRFAVSVVCGLAWATAIVLAGWLAVAAPDAVTPEAHLTHYGYGRAMAVIGVGVLAAVVLALGMLLTRLGDEWASPRAPTPPAPGTAQTPPPPATPPH